jgi:hypothetical protein
LIQYKEEMLAKIEKVYKEIKYYGDLIKQKKKSENRKRNHKHSFKIKDLVCYIHLEKRKNYQRNS